MKQHNGATPAETCRCCGADATRFAESKVLGHTTGYYRCAACGYVQTGDPHWLKEAYREPINAEDTGIMARNRKNVGCVVATLWALEKPRGLVLDEAGGYGVLDVAVVRELAPRRMLLRHPCSPPTTATQ